MLVGGVLGEGGTSVLVGGVLGKGGTSVPVGGVLGDGGTSMLVGAVFIFTSRWCSAILGYRCCGCMSSSHINVVVDSIRCWTCVAHVFPLLVVRQTATTAPVVSVCRWTKTRSDFFLQERDHCRPTHTMIRKRICANEKSHLHLFPNYPFPSTHTPSHSILPIAKHHDPESSCRVPSRTEPVPPLDK